MPLSASQEWKRQNFESGNISTRAVIDWHRNLRERFTGADYFDVRAQEEYNKVAYGTDWFGSERRQGAIEANRVADTYKDKITQMYGTFYTPRTVAQMDPVHILMKRWGIRSSGYVGNKRGMTLDDRIRFMEEVERRYGKNAESMDFYYYMLYMYLKGCAYISELNKIAVAQNGSPLSEDDLMRVMYQLYLDRKNSFEVRDNAGVHAINDNVYSFTNIIRQDYETSGNSWRDVGGDIYGKGNMYENMRKAMRAAGLNVDRKSDYWKRVQLYDYKRDSEGNIKLDKKGNKIGKKTHQVLVGKKGELIETMPDRPFEDKKRQQYIDAGIDLDWYRNAMGR